MALTPSQIQDYYKTQTGSAKPLSPTDYEASLTKSAAPTPGAPVAPSPAPTSPATTTPGQATSSSTALRTDLATQGIDPTTVPVKSFDEFKAGIVPATPPPKAPDYSAEYTGLRASQGVQSLEDQDTALEAKANALQDSFDQFKAKEFAGQTEGFAEGRISTERQKITDQLDSINRQRQLTQDQLKYKNNFISTVMDNTKQDYSTALDTYDRAFTQATTMQSLYDSYQSKQISESQRVMTNARGTISAMTTLMSNSGMTVQDILKSNPAFSNQLNSLELSAGYPVGFVETFANSKPRANIIATYDSTDENGNKFVAIVSQDAKTGAPTVSRMYTGGVSTGTPAAFKSDAFTAAQDYFQNGTTIGGVTYNGVGGDGYVDPNLYSALRTQYGQYRNPTEFDAEFGHLVNPSSRVHVGLDKPKAGSGGVTVTNAKGVTVSVQ